MKVTDEDIFCKKKASLAQVLKWMLLSLSLSLSLSLCGYCSEVSFICLESIFKKEAKQLWVVPPL